MMILTPRLLSIYHLLAVAVSVISASPIPQGLPPHTLLNLNVDDSILPVPNMTGDIDILVHGSLFDGDDHDDVSPVPQVAGTNMLMRRSGDEDEDVPADYEKNASKGRRRKSYKSGINNFLLDISRHPDNTKSRTELTAQFKHGGKWDYGLMRQEGARLNIDTSNLPLPQAPAIKPTTEQNRRKLNSANFRIRKDFIDKAFQRMKGENSNITREEVEGQFKKENSALWDNEKITKYAKENSITLSGTLED